jgi:Xaa-Pro aminopeptidase
MVTKRINNYSLFKNRRKNFMANVCQENPNVKNGVILLFADFENDRNSFIQESSFFYLTGVNEPGAVLFLYLDGRGVLYIPSYAENRKKWVGVDIEANEQEAKKIGFDEIKFLGNESKGYFIQPIFDKTVYATLLEDLEIFLKEQNSKVFLCSVSNFQKQAFSLLSSNLLNENYAISDISKNIHELRRSKCKSEIECIKKAIRVTHDAFINASKKIVRGKVECEIQAEIESVFTSKGCGVAFPTIVASGKNSTILHYTLRNRKIKKGDLVVVDIGAQYQNYAADLTRTFPVGGKFSVRQKEIYNIVLGAQKYIANLAKPGMFLNNPSAGDQSLNHLAKKYFERLGYGESFSHGIGHFLGLDVHDVGDASQALGEGCVITIEPGIYIEKENLGIRIEDNFLITKNGCLCLSKKLPKEIDEIEKMMR